MLKEEDIKDGIIITCIDTLDNFTVGKDYTITLNEYAYYELRDDYNVLRMVTHTYKARLNKFKLKETTMLDPEIYAVGTVHKHNKFGTQYRIVARNVKTNEFKSGVAMVVIYHDSTRPTPLMVCQETGVLYDGYESGLYVAPKKYKGWINIYNHPHNEGLGTKLYDNKDTADRAKSINRIACIEIEYEEGQGL